MINYKSITQGAETVLVAQLSDRFTIERGPKRPEGDWIPALHDGWIGIYRLPRTYTAAYVTSNDPYMLAVQLAVEVRVVSAKSAEDCEDKLLDAEKDILDALTNTDVAYKNLAGTIGHFVSFDVEDTLDEQDDQRYYQGITITVNAEVRA
jgi:hypothetical protein